MAYEKTYQFGVFEKLTEKQLNERIDKHGHELFPKCLNLSISENLSKTQPYYCGKYGLLSKEDVIEGITTEGSSLPGKTSGEPLYFYPKIGFLSEKERKELNHGYKLKITCRLFS